MRRSQLRQQELITLIIKIFFIGMAIQFFAHTFVTYTLGLPSSLSFIRIRKEVLIIGLLGYCIRKLRTHTEYRKQLFGSQRFKRIIGMVGGAILLSFINSIFIHHQHITAFITSAKYNFTPLVIFVAGYAVMPLLEKKHFDQIIHTLIATIQFVLIFSLFRYLILHTAPNGLSIFGYAKPALSIEWVTAMRPPSLYLTDFFSGFVRNQGPFGGPLSLGFYLAALWPIFYSIVLYKKKWTDTWGRRLLYIAIVISSFSRAARAMFFIASVLLFIVTHKKYTKHIILTGILGAVAIFIYIKNGGTSELFIRKRSDQGHIYFFLEGLQLVKENRLRGLGASSVGPGANFGPDSTSIFNPENQYMQIRLEYGLFGIITRITSYCIIALKPLQQVWMNRTRPNQLSQYTLLFSGIGISILTLAIAGMVLHPFVDSSSMYPIMMANGIIASGFILWRNHASLPLFTKPHNRKEKRKSLHIAHKYASSHS